MQRGKGVWAKVKGGSPTLHTSVSHPSSVCRLVFYEIASEIFNVLLTQASLLVPFAPDYVLCIVTYASGLTMSGSDVEPQNVK
jgi:hypothetical protein